MQSSNPHGQAGVTCSIHVDAIVGFIGAISSLKLEPLYHAENSSPTLGTKYFLSLKLSAEWCSFLKASSLSLSNGEIETLQNLLLLFISTSAGTEIRRGPSNLRERNEAHSAP